MKKIQKIISFVLTALLLLSTLSVTSFAAVDTSGYNVFYTFDNSSDVASNKLTGTNDNFMDIADTTSGKASVGTAVGFGKNSGDRMLHVMNNSQSATDHYVSLDCSDAKKLITVPSDKYYITSAQYRVSQNSRMNFGVRFDSDTPVYNRPTTWFKFNGYGVTFGTDDNVVKTFTKDQWVTITLCVDGGTGVVNGYIDGERIGSYTQSAVCEKIYAVPARVYFYGFDGAESNAYVDNICGCLSATAYTGAGADANTDITAVSGGNVSVDNDKKVISIQNFSNKTITAADLRNSLDVTAGKALRIYSAAPGAGDVTEATDSAAITKDTVVYVEAANGIDLKAYTIKFVEPLVYYDIESLGNDYSTTVDATLSVSEEYKPTVDIGDEVEAEVSTATGFGKASGDMSLEISQKSLKSNGNLMQIPGYYTKALNSGEYYIASAQYRVQRNSKMLFTMRFSEKTGSVSSTERTAVRIANFDGYTARIGGTSSSNDGSTVVNFAEDQWVTVTGVVGYGSETVSVYIDGEFIADIKGSVAGMKCYCLQLVPGMFTFYGDANELCNAYLDNVYAYVSTTPYSAAAEETSIAAVTGATVDNTARTITIDKATSNIATVADLKEAISVTGAKTVRIYSAAPGAGDVTEAAEGDEITENTVVYVEAVNGMALKAYAVKFVADLEAAKTVDNGKATVTLKANKAFAGDALVALYSGSELVAVKVVANAEIENKTVNFDTDGTLRVFVWNMETLVPTAIDIDIAQ